MHRIRGRPVMDSLSRRDFVKAQETAYPETGITTVTVNADDAVAFDLRFRVPGWAATVTAEINGEAVAVDAIPETWALIGRMWQPSDRLTIRLPLPCTFAPVDPQHPGRGAILNGPLVLVLGEAGNRVPFYQVGRGAAYAMYSIAPIDKTRYC